MGRRSNLEESTQYSAREDGGTDLEKSTYYSAGKDDGTAVEPRGE